MKEKRKFLAVFTAVLLLMLSCAAIAGATSVPEGAAPLDVGNFSDYSGGGWDSGGWDSGSSWDSDYSSSWDSDYSSGDGFLSGLFLGGCLGDFSPVVIIVIVVLVLVFVLKGRSHSGKGGPGSSANTAVKDNTDVITAAVKAVDPNFDPAEVTAMAKDTFVTLQEAWTARDWETVRTLETDDLFRLHNKQLQEYIRLGRINVMERICVNQAYLHKYEREEQYEHITVYLTTRMRDYIIDEKTKKVLMGDPNKDIFGKYLMKFTRTYGITTQTASSEAETIACPHCGAPTHVTQSGKCEYCGFIIETGTHAWVLSGLDGVKQGTPIDNSGVILRTDKIPGGSNSENGSDAKNNE
jgi:ribosomal protein L37E